MPEGTGAFAHGNPFEDTVFAHDGAKFILEAGLRHAAIKVTRNAGSRQNGGYLVS